MRSVDTNVLVRLIARDDAKQTAAAESFVANGAWVSHLVLIETIWVLDSVYDRSASELATAIEMLLTHNHLTIQGEEVVSAALETFKSLPKLGFSDCLILEVARKVGNLPLGTFDRGLSKLQGTEKL
ncbi:MAG: type II toxin-antitoxin system VapC family toxin [Pyrinomonadaceae bacterium]